MAMRSLPTCRLRVVRSYGLHLDCELDCLACKSFRIGERGRNRTFNLLIKSQLLCQLSYAPFAEGNGRGFPERLIKSNIRAIFPATATRPVVEAEIISRCGFS